MRKLGAREMTRDEVQQALAEAYEAHEGTLPIGKALTRTLMDAGRDGDVSLCCSIMGLLAALDFMLSLAKRAQRDQMVEEMVHVGALLVAKWAPESSRFLVMTGEANGEETRH